MTTTTSQTVTAAEWRAAREELLKDEKAATQTMAALAARRRELPKVKVERPESFLFTGPDGAQKTLLDLFKGRPQLILYDFMLTERDVEGCVGCSFVMDHIPAQLGHLHSRDTTFTAVATASIEKITAFKERMGWTFPFYHRSKDAFAAAEAAGEEVTWKPVSEGFFGIAVFRREGDEVFHTYSTTHRGVEVLLSTYALLDMTSMGRQEVGNGMGNFRLHDKY